jgi:hypothetical protein
VYRYEDLPQGGAVRIVTTSDRARQAVHEFLRYQIKEHQTGDPTEAKGAAFYDLSRRAVNRTAWTTSRIA